MVRSLVLCVLLALCALPSCLACADHARVVQVSSVKTRLQDGLTVAATPSSLQQRVEQVTVSWSGLDSPQSTDWIGLYSPGSGVDFAVTGPVKLQFLTNQTADGSISFTVLNTHFDVIFALFRGGLDAPVLAGASNTVQFAQPNQPMGIHLARRVLPSEMLATWTSLDSSSPAVLWGPASGQYPFNASASSQTYAQSDMCGGAAATVGWHSPGRVHTAVMTGLAPAQAYYYVVGDAALNLWSAEQVFVTAPQPGADQPVEIIALGDVGTAETDGSQVGGHDAGYNAASLSVTAAMVNELQNNPFSLVMHVGDVTYSDGWLAEWPAFTNQVEPIAASVPWMVVPGNHERDYPNSGTGVLNTTDSGGECGIPYNTFFTMPTAVTGPTLADQPWYSFDHGPIHFLCISTEHDFNESTLQYAFIEQDFQAVDRSATPFLIFVGHRPMYVDSKDKDKPFSDQAFALVLQAVLEPLFIKYRDMAWWGHHHTFQRTCGVANGACVNSNTPGAYNGTVHIVMGNGGTTLSKLDKDTPAIFEYVNEKHWGYNRVSVTREQLLFAQIDASNGEVKDAVTLYAQSFGEEALRSNQL